MEGRTGGPRASTEDARSPSPRSLVDTGSGVRAEPLEGTVHFGILESPLDKIMKIKKASKIPTCFLDCNFKKCATLPPSLTLDPASEFLGSRLLSITISPVTLNSIRDAESWDSRGHPGCLPGPSGASFQGGTEALRNRCALAGPCPSPGST